MGQESGLTRLMYERATSQALTLRQAVEQLERDAHVRTVRETLAKYAGLPAEDSKALLAFLTGALLEQSPKRTGRSGIERKVRMWLGGDVRALSKQGAIQLCFALKLPVEEAGTFLCRTCGEGFHWRDPKELVYLFALREGLDYPAAQTLERDLAAKGLLDRKSAGDPSVQTEVVRQRAERLSSVRELEDFLREARDELGAMHNTAYHLFREYLGLLCAPESALGLEPAEELSVREVTGAYLHERLVPRIQRRTRQGPESQERLFSALERDIQQNWPDETSLSKMLNRRLDVSRKALILLFLATDGDTLEGVQAEEAWSVGQARADGEELDWEQEEGFEDRFLRLNAMLCDCGFAPLDSRAPFDWMILYCMCVEESMFIDERVDRFLAEVFPRGAEMEGKGKEEAVVG